MTLKELEIGKSAVIKVVGGEGALRQHFLDMGVIPGAEVTVIKFAPMGDPMELQIHGYELTLRLSDAEQIEIELISERSRRHEGAKNINQSVHPGLGEEGKYHVKGDGRPLPEQEKLTYALVGNQNCGKTTLFNQLTGSNQHIGNFPGVTVDRKDGAIKGHPNTSVTDLPGIYSMSPYSSEEIVSRNFVLDDKPKAMINIIDATNIERNLYLTMQLLEMDIPMVIALNMMDEMTGNSGSVDVNGMEAMLGVPVVPISAAKNEGVDELVRHALHGYELTLRLSDAEQIEIELISERSRRHEGAKNINQSVHPGLGEEGKYHVKGDGRPLPEQEKLTYALVGNQNCGKTTLFNQLTGSNQHIGNFPGVTVDRKDGAIKGHPNTSVTDLPGIYSMSPYSSEEIVSRNFVLDDKPKAMINIIDATNIERNLYLTMQLLEMDIPMVIALNMMDEMTGNSGSVDVNGMEAMLGVPVVPISAAKNEGVDELVRHALHIAKYQERPGRQDFCDESDFGGAVHRCIHAVSHLIEDHAKEAQIPIRFAASKIIEGDHLILEKLAWMKTKKKRSNI